MVPSPRVETFGSLSLPCGGKHGYVGVRGGQGSSKDKYQGYTPRKRHFTKVCNTAHDAAVARAQLLQDIELGLVGAAEHLKEKSVRKRKSAGMLPCPMLAYNMRRVG